MTVLVRNPTDELAIFRVLPVVMDLPNDLRDDWSYWHLITAVQQQSGVVPLGPIRNVTYDYLRVPEDIAKVKLRHGCPDCRSALASAHDLLVADPVEVLCVAQCVVDYLEDPRHMTTRFSPVASAED